MIDTVIVGAGVAGLTSARALQNAGREVLVLEKSRGLGGRSATRRLEGNRVDHGAQYFTVRDSRLQKQVDDWFLTGDLLEWSRGFHRLNSEGLSEPTKGHPKYVFKNGMNTVGKLLATSLTVQNESRVQGIQALSDGWQLDIENSAPVLAKTVLVNTPAEQAQDLLRFDAQETKQALETVVMQASFALMLGYPLKLAPIWQGVHIDLDDSPLSWVAHDSSKRDAPQNTILTLHSTARFAQENFEQDKDTVAKKMLADLSKHFPDFANPLFTNMQRWKYALASQHLEQPFLQHSNSLYFCGDWCGGAKLEAAYLSGLELSDHLLNS